MPYNVHCRHCCHHCEHDDAGAVALSGLSSFGAIVNSSFSSNSAPKGAGSAVSIISNSLFIVHGTNLTSNIASASQGSQGGAIFHSSQYSGQLTLLLSNSILADNYGGALYAVGSYVIMNSTSFRGNDGGHQAGAVACENCVRLLMYRCELSNNTSLNPGGAVQTAGSVSSGVLLHQVTATGNRWAALPLSYLSLVYQGGQDALHGRLGKQTAHCHCACTEGTRNECREWTSAAGGQPYLCHT